MNVSINIKVRNPEWYWGQQDIKASMKKGEMSYDEWKMINEGKIYKHLPAITFDYKFKVESFSENCETNYEITVYDLKNEEAEKQERHKVTLEDVTVVEFKGENNISHVVVANALKHEFRGAQKSGATHYWYFYLKENAEYVKLMDNIWITAQQFEQIQNQFKEFGFAVENDANLKILELRGSFPVSFDPPLMVANESDNERW